MKIYLPKTKRPVGWRIFIHNGLEDHPKTTLVDSYEQADFVIIGLFSVADKQVLENPNKLIVIDYRDRLSGLLHPQMCYLYFKRRILDDARTKVVLDNVIPIAYPVKREYLIARPANVFSPRPIDVACFFNLSYPRNLHWNENRARVANFISKSVAADSSVRAHIGEIGKAGNLGRNRLQPSYHEALLGSKIVITCNPKNWEGDHRLFEAMISGALVFVDRMQTPMKNPLLDKVHLVYYDLENLDQLLSDVMFYLEHDAERHRIAQQGFEFVQKHHTYLNRIDEILEAIDVKKRQNDLDMV